MTSIRGHTAPPPPAGGRDGRGDAAGAGHRGLRGPGSGCVEL